MARRALVYGLAVAGEATVRALRVRGWHVVVADDTPSAQALEAAAALGVDLYEHPDERRIGRLVDRVELVVPSPGVPERHAVITAARMRGVAVRTEIDLAWEWEQERPGGPRPIVGVTGTDGKTTTTLLATEMVRESGRRAVAAGNTEVPLVAALDLDVDAFVVECTSFRLRFAERFAPSAAVWLNLAPDHLDWHGDLARYGAAKARIWEHQSGDDVAIGFTGDPVVLDHLGRARARHVTFGEGGDYRVAGGLLRGPSGDLAPVGVLRRALPHDITNALAASALVIEAGLATSEGVSTALAAFAPPPHRIAKVADIDGVAYYDDSKATTPHAVLTAVRGFPSVVLIAGGRNKDLDLRPMSAERDRMRAVVAIGEATPEIEAAFDGVCAVRTAGSMAEAVEAARSLASAGDVVLLSPGCTSFDWYSSYAERGDDFTRAVKALVDAQS
jgi:UDP-N-acetylmuramoylalanine--D-glutamate ligase